MNGKEKPNASFQKFTSHTIQDVFKIQNNEQWNLYKVNEQDREYRVWKRDPLASIVESREGAEKVLDYMHFNPLQEHWSLVGSPERL